MLTEYQIKVLKLYVQGKNQPEIVKLTGLKRNSANYALKSGIENIDDMIDVLECALENNLLDDKQRAKLTGVIKNHVK
jgi:transcriptional regulator